MSNVKRKVEIIREKKDGRGQNTRTEMKNVYEGLMMEKVQSKLQKAGKSGRESRRKHRARNRAQ